MRLLLSMAHLPAAPVVPSPTFLTSLRPIAETPPSDSSSRCSSGAACISWPAVMLQKPPCQGHQGPYVSPVLILQEPLYCI